MAIDTIGKRQSATGVGRPYMRSHSPVLAKNARWRASSGSVYSGNLFGVGVGFRAAWASVSTYVEGVFFGA